jgi:hypothetical protein
MEAASRAIDRLTLSLALPSLAWEVFTNISTFRLLQPSRGATHKELLKDSALRNAILEPVDLILIWHDNGGGQGLYLDIWTTSRLSSSVVIST